METKRGRVATEVLTAAPAPAPAVVAAPAAPVPLAVEAAPMQVGHAEDQTEHDADQRADRALTRLARSIATSTATATWTPQAHQHGAGCGHLRRTADPTVARGTAIGLEGGALPADSASAIQRLRGGGRPLEEPVRRRMEEGFGTSFASVRIHDGPVAASLNRSVSAQAFTTGRDVFFGAGQYAPDTQAGERVLAHELAHTLQPDQGLRRLALPSWLTNIFKPSVPTPEQVKERTTKTHQASDKADFATQRAAGDRGRGLITDKVAAHGAAQQAGRDAMDESAQLTSADADAEHSQTPQGRTKLTAQAFGADGLATIALFKKAVAEETRLLAAALATKNGVALTEDERLEVYRQVWNDQGEFKDIFFMAPTRSNKQELELRDVSAMEKAEEDGTPAEAAARAAAHLAVSEDVNRKRAALLDARLAAPAADVEAQPWWSRKKAVVSGPVHATQGTQRGLFSKAEQAELQTTATTTRARSGGRVPPPLPQRPGLAKAAGAVDKARGDVEAADAAVMEPSRAATALAGAVSNHQHLDPTASDDDQYTSQETKAADGLGLAKDIVSHLFDAFDHVKKGVEVYDGWGTADQATKLEIAKTAYEMTGNAVKLAKDAASMTALINDDLAKAVGKVIPGFNIVIAVKSLIDGVLESVAAGSARRAAVQALFDARVVSSSGTSTRAGDRVDVAVPALEHSTAALNLRMSRAINGAIGGIVSMVTSIGSVATLGAMALVEAADGVRSILHSIINTLVADSRARAAQAARRHGALEGGALERLTHDPKVVAGSLINQARTKNNATVRTFLNSLGIDDAAIDGGNLTDLRTAFLEAVQESPDPQTTVDKISTLYRRVTG